MDEGRRSEGTDRTVGVNTVMDNIRMACVPMNWRGRERERGKEERERESERERERD